MDGRGKRSLCGGFSFAGDMARPRCPVFAPLRTRPASVPRRRDCSHRAPMRVPVRVRVFPCRVRPAMPARCAPACRPMARMGCGESGRGIRRPRAMQADRRPLTSRRQDIEAVFRPVWGRFQPFASPFCGPPSHFPGRFLAAGSRFQALCKPLLRASQAVRQSPSEQPASRSRPSGVAAAPSPSAPRPLISSGARVHSTALIVPQEAPVVNTFEDICLFPLTLTKKHGILTAGLRITRTLIPSKGDDLP